MSKQKQTNPSLKHQKIERVNFDNWINIIILLVYGFITVITPDFKSFDANGPKFLALALFNSIILIYFLSNEYKNNSSNNFLIFLKTKAGLLYTSLILLSLLSFVKSINVIESIVTFSKYFTPFTAIWIISTILRKDKEALNYLIVGMSVLLIFDSLRVFSGIHQFINGELADIIELKGGYSNKNVFAAALLIKIPFSLWLLTFQSSWKKKLGWISLLFGALAILFLSTRSMYLGLIALSIFYVIYLLIRYLQTKQKENISNIYSYLVSLILAIAVYSAVQTFLYPKVESLYNQGVADRLATIQTEAGNSERLKSWILTADLIKKNPVMGVGLGNWKIAVLEKENPSRFDFTYHLKTHNDYLEIIAEVGILGGLCFIFIFIFVFINLTNYLLGKPTTERLDLLFLSAFGLLAYSFDAFFNFPQDRPEIQSLFAIYLGIGIATSRIETRKENLNPTDEIKTLKSNTSLSKAILALILSITIFTIYILFLNVKSLQIQRIFKEEQLKGKWTITSDFLIKKFPSIPNLSSSSEPISTLIANRLIAENKYEEIPLILKENPNPFDTRREFSLSLAYYNTDRLDSAEHYISFCHRLKPKFYVYSKTYAIILEKMGKEKEAIALLDSFLIENKGEKEAWQYNAALNSKVGNQERAMQLMDSAYRFFPSDTTILKLKEFYTYSYKIPNYLEAVKYYKEGNFKEAAKYYQLSESDFEKSGNPSEVPNFLNSWAQSLLEINEVMQAKTIFERVATQYPKNYFSLKNLGFIALQHEKNYAKAIDYYTRSLNADSPDFFQSYMNLGTIYLMQNQKDLAISNYENALKYGTSEMVIGNLSLLWKEKGNQEKSNYYGSLLQKK
jgi:putative inorganic carbon (hco3(-)) transporter